MLRTDAKHEFQGALAAGQTRPKCADWRFATKCIGELAIRAPGLIYPTRDAVGAALNQTFDERS